MLKKVIAVLAALLIVTRIVLMGVSAAMVGTGVMLGIVAILAAALVSSGQYTQSQINSMNNNDIISSYRSSVESGVIDPKERIKLPEGVTYEGSEYGSVVDCFFDYEKFVFDSWKYHVTEGWAIIDNAIDDWFRDKFSDIYNNKTKLEDIVNPTLKGNINMYGMGAMSIDPNFHYDLTTHGKSSDIYFLCQYIIVDLDAGTYTTFAPCKEYYIYSDGYIMWNLGHGYDYVGSYNFVRTYDGRQRFYGDVRYVDGTKVETDDEYEYPLGETEDGTKVTVDMLNPDANVKLDRVTGEVLDPSTPITPDVVVQNPSDYINIDYYTDPAVIDLLQQILNALDKANVVAPDDTKDIIDEIAGDIELEISSSLMDYTVPKTIATVFPFCLPFDFVRGMKLMVEKPKVPVFKAELDLTNICGYDLGEHEIVISFEDWEPAAVICRWFCLLMFSYTLILLTGKIVKGAGA